MTDALSSQSLSSDELRALVRAVLRDVLPDVASATSRSASRVVSLRTDADLDALVREVAAAAADPARREELCAGRHGYRLARDDEDPAPQAGGGVGRVERGAVPERTVRRAAAEGARLVVGPRAVLTPLARDRARALGVVLEKEQEMRG